MLNYKTIQDNWNIKIVDELELVKNQGYMSRVWKCKDNSKEYILKEFAIRFDERSIYPACECQKYLALFGLAPNVYYTKDMMLYCKIDKHFYFLSDKIEGTNIKSRNLSKEIISCLGKFVASIHLRLSTMNIHLEDYHTWFEVPNVERKKIEFKDLIASDISGYSFLEEQYYYFLKFVSNKHLNFKFPFQFIHGDMHLNNIIMSLQNNDLKIIDFDQVSFFPRVYEIGRFLLTIINLEKDFHGNIKIFQIFFHAYTSIYPLSKDEKSGMFDYYYFCLISNVICYYKEYEVKDNLKFVLERLQKMRWINENINLIKEFLNSDF